MYIGFLCQNLVLYYCKYKAPTNNFIHERCVITSLKMYIGFLCQILVLLCRKYITSNNNFIHERCVITSLKMCIGFLCQNLVLLCCKCITSNNNFIHKRCVITSLNNCIYQYETFVNMLISKSINSMGNVLSLTLMYLWGVKQSTLHYLPTHLFHSGPNFLIVRVSPKLGLFIAQEVGGGVFSPNIQTFDGDEELNFFLHLFCSFEGFH